MTAQWPTEAARSLPRDTGLTGLYAGALGHLAGRAARLIHRAVHALDPCDAPDAPTTARNRAVAAGHPSALPSLVGSPRPRGEHP